MRLSQRGAGANQAAENPGGRAFGGGGLGGKGTGQQDQSGTGEPNYHGNRYKLNDDEGLRKAILLRRNL